MRKTLATHFTIAVLLFGAAFAFDWWSKDTRPLKRYAADIESYLRKQEAAALRLLETQANFFSVQLAGQKIEGKSGDLHAQKLAEIAAEPFTICLAKGNSLVSWSNNKAIPSEADLKKWQQPDFQPGIQEVRAGHYEILRQPFQGMTAFILIPVKYAFAAKNELTQTAFPANDGIPTGVDLSAQPTDFTISAKDGRPIGWLKAKGDVKFLQFLQIKFWLFLAAFVAFFLFVNSVARMLAEKYQAWVGALVLIPVVGGMVFLNLKYNLTGQFADLDLFARKFDKTLLSLSIGDMLINIGILLWLMVFFHRHFQVQGYKNVPLPFRFFFGVGNYMSIVVSVLVSAWIFRELVYKSNISFDFTNIFKLDMYSVMAIVGVIFLLGAMFLFSHRMVITVFRIDLNRFQRTAAALVAVGMAMPIMWAFRAELEVDPWQLVAFSMFYAMAFDYFLDQKTKQLPWIVAWLIVFSWFATILLFKYNDSKDLEWRRLYAETIASERDSLAEVQLEEFRNDLLTDFNLPQLLNPQPFLTKRDTLANYVSRHFYRKNYLFQHYRFEVAAFDNRHVAALDSQAVSHSLMEKLWQAAAPVRNDDTRLWKDSTGYFRYLLRMEVPAEGDSSQMVRLFFMIDRSERTPTNVFSLLFFNKPYKNLPFLSRYDFAIFKKGELIFQRGKLSEESMRPEAVPKINGQSIPYQIPKSDREDLVYKSRDGETVVVIGRKTGGIYKMLYLFSYIFTTLTVFMLLLAAANSVLGLLPASYEFKLSSRGLLSKRIQFYMSGVIIVSFFVIGWLTLDNFHTSSQENIKEQLNTRTSSMLSQIESGFNFWLKSGDRTTQILKEKIDPLAKIYSTDVNLYDQRGDLIYSSQPELQELGAVSPKMSSMAFYALSSLGSAEFIDEEQTGSYKYNTAFLPLRNRKQETYAYIGVPYYLRDSGIRTDISDFIGKLLSLYVFLILAAGFIAMGVADSIVKPIKKLSTQMQEMRLEEKNEPLNWEGHDELSDLIGEYNKMLGKLEASKLALTKLEREGAWREMARQVAHEINNPLTTMKLSIQQLERAWRIDPADSEAYLKKATLRLVEQVDNLAQIATEFKMFAKIDQPSKNDLVINEVVQSVFDLFSEHENVDFKLDMPAEKFHVLGDNGHLIRVFNNLIINALQAIPGSRRGQIRVSVFEKNNRAVVRVSDNGGGVPTEIREKIFEPNFTTKTSGSGLGLAICKRIIDSLDGDMYFKVREEEGTDFFIEMPIVSVEKEGETA